MAIYRIINNKCRYTSIGDNLQFDWPNEEIRKSTLQRNWGQWDSKEGMVGKLVWEFFNYFNSKLVYILEVNDSEIRYVAISAVGCELIEQKQNKYTEKYLQLNP